MPHKYRKLARNQFLSLLVLGGSIYGGAAVLLYYTISLLYTRSHPLLNKLEETCGCTALTAVSPGQTAVYVLLAALAFIFSAFLFRGVYTAFIIQKNTKRFVANLLQLQTTSLPPILKKIAASLELTNRVIVLHHNEPIIFSYGFLNPRIVVSSEFISSLETYELRAVLEHEQEHMRSYDPLKIYIAQIFTNTLSFIPAVATALKQFEMLSELSADEQATRNYRSKKYLASALYKLLAYEAVSNSSYAVSMFSAEYTMEKRVTALTDTSYTPSYSHGTGFVGSLITITIVVLALFMLQLPASQAQEIQYDNAQCIHTASQINSECKMIQMEYCDINFSAVQSVLCNKMF